MPSAPEEAYSNPLAPVTDVHEEERPQQLTNADFRKLLMTPRVPQTGSRETFPSHTVPTENEQNQTASKSKDAKLDTKASERKKKKSFYAKIKKEEEEKMAELAEKYRDRARERRDGKNPDYNQAEDPIQPGIGGFRAVAPDLKSGFDAAEIRKKMIEDSKYLGGDLEHTHLVKGLDYALLHKVRSEITSKEIVVEPEQIEEAPEKPLEDGELLFHTATGKRIYNAVFGKKDFGESFIPGRIAYSIALEDDAESDIPITVIRSKLEIASNENLQATFTSNDIVIQKLTQILSYLRTGRALKKHKKKEKLKEVSKSAADDSIFPDAGEYVPSHKSSKPHKDGDSKKSRSNNSSSSRSGRSYFARSSNDESKHKSSRKEESTYRKTREEVPPPPEEAAPVLPAKLAKESIAKKTLETGFYTECYPGMAEMQDAIDDSDDEADYTKMDLGNKKGPVGRWDFDTQEEYSNYMNQREAMPKAAFQYGVKMTDGRKTRRIGINKEKDRNSELNREWQQIQKLINRRKEDGGRSSKRARYE